MRTLSEIRGGIGLLLTIQLILTFGVMGLLVRMSPAIERIVAENVRSVMAAESMQRALAQRECVAPDQTAAAFETGLERAGANVTVPGEAEILGEVQATYPAALAGDCDAIVTTSEQLSGLSELNRQGMDRADEEAKQLGVAGTWAAALLGLITFVAGMAILRRMTLRIADPLTEIESVLAAVQRGDPYRRCRRLDAPAEYGVIATRLNQLLDRRLAKAEEEDPQLAMIDRTLLHHLLDRMPHPTVAVDTSGAILAASDSAMDILAGGGVSSLPDVLIGGGGEDASLIERVEAFGKHDGFLITLRPIGPLPRDEAAAEAPAAEPSAGEAAEAPRIVNPLADQGAGDAPRELPQPEPRTDDRPDWERD